MTASRSSSSEAFDELQSELSNSEAVVDINQRKFGDQQFNIVRVQYFFALPYVGTRMFLMRNEAISE